MNDDQDTAKEEGVNKNDSQPASEVEYPLYEAEEGIDVPLPPPPASLLEKILAIVKRFFIPVILIIIAVLLIVFFLRFLRGSKVAEKEANLTYWTLWENEEIYQPLIASFLKTYPKVTITVVKQTPREYRERLENAILRGEGPDIFRFHNTWLPMLLKQDIIAPIPEEIMKKSEFESTFYSVAQSDLQANDRYYGIPLNFDSLGLYYNKKILEASGVSPPSTWEQLRKIANELTVRDANGRITTAGIALGTTNNVEFWSDILGMMILQNSGSILSPKGANSEDALLFYTRFAKTPDNVWDETLDNSVLAFAGGKVAMIFAPSWMAHEVKALNPDLDFAIAPVPQLPGVNIAWASYWVEGVSKMSENKDMAFAFLKSLSSKDGMTKLYAEQAKTRLFGEPYPRSDLASTLKGDPYLDSIVSQGPFARSGYLSSRTFDNGLNDRIIRYYQDAVNSVNKGASPRSALETVGRGINEVLSDFGITFSL